MTPTSTERKVRFGAARLLAPEIEELIHDAPAELAEATEGLHPADLAEIAEDLPAEDRVVLINHVPVDRAADVIGYLGPGLLKEVVSALDPERAALVLRDMSPDERADAVGALEREFAESVLARLPKGDREETRRLLAYPRHSAGGLMTPDFVRLAPDGKVGAALDETRRVAMDVETIYTIYITDPAGKLVGVISLRDLFVAPAEAPLREVMLTDFVSANVNTDQEEVANLISKYDLLSLPVTDGEGRLLGIVTVDDVMDVLVEEATEDVQKMGAVTPLDAPYFDASFWKVARSRAGWLGMIFLGELLTTPALQHYEKTIQGSVHLVLFLPLILSTGGNSGSQSATLITRALALGDVRGKDAARVAVRELLTGCLMGGVLSLIGIGRAIWVTHRTDLALAVGLAVIGVAMAGALLGGIIPIFVRRLGYDPAVVSSPAVASLLDVTGIVIYFTIASALMHT
jgi:magnesium transporter